MMAKPLPLFSENIFDQVPWDRTWYQDGTKISGGWSLELVNPNDPCGQETNWTESVNPNGGTPGTPNSVSSSEPLFLEFLNASLIQANLFRLDFGAIINNNSNNASLYSFESGRVATTVSPDGQDPTAILVHFDPPLDTGEVDQLTIFMELENCIGLNLSNDTTITIGLGEVPTKGDLLINELLFQPFTGGFDFIELVNASNKVLSTENLWIRNYLLESDPKEVLVNQRGFILPGEFLVWTENPSHIKSQYTVHNPENLVEQDLPSFNADGGNASIIYRYEGIQCVLDSFDYHPDLHHILLDSDGFRGVSLERASTNLETNLASNWHSAAVTAGFATPTGPNSQSTHIPIANEGEIELVNSVFSPDGDGFKDFLIIRLANDQPGTIANIDVYDAEGRLKRDLLNNELIGNNNSIKWDGFDNDGRLGSAGNFCTSHPAFSRERKRS